MVAGSAYLAGTCRPGHTDSYVKDKIVPVTIALNHFRDGKKGQAWRHGATNQKE